jgi:hypothetical protein
MAEADGLGVKEAVAVGFSVNDAGFEGSGGLVGKITPGDGLHADKIVARMSSWIKVE